MIIGRIRDGVYYRPGDPGFEDTGKVKSSCTSICSKRPWVSTSLAVNPSQVKEFNEAARAAKTGAYYDSKGRMCADSNAARNRELARRGYGDADAGYGQRPPGG